MTQEQQLQAYIDQLNVIRVDVAKYHSAAAGNGDLITGAEVRELLQSLKDLEKLSAPDRITLEAIDAAVAEGS